MTERGIYDSPLGKLHMSAEDGFLTELTFEKREVFAENEGSVVKETKRWLDIYFSGSEPDFTPPLKPDGTPFQKEVWAELLKIPYGTAAAYGEIGERIAKRHGKKGKMGQAIGSAASKNKICIIIPCHRVIGSNGNLTGYAGGIDKKVYLLKRENAWRESFSLPSRGSGK